jgi:glutamate-1-semialdehyde 2,1-aminomutase
MTGFRLAKGGAQEVFNIMPDITTLGKIIGGGMPVGAYGGKKEIMKYVSPEGPVYQAGTLSGNPIAMSAGFVMLNHLNTHGEIYSKLDDIAKRIIDGFKVNLSKAGINYTINNIGSMLSLFFTENEVSDFESAKTSDTDQFGRYFNAMLENGGYIAPSQFESLFISISIDEKIADLIIEANLKSLERII